MPQQPEHKSCPKLALTHGCAHPGATGTDQGLPAVLLIVLMIINFAADSVC